MADKNRDVDIFPIGGGRALVIACDSCGAIGEKVNDQVAAPPLIVGKYTARVALMEILSVGASLAGLTVNICNELEPTGKEILKGIERELLECQLQTSVTISTEKNMTTSMTALGVTAIGIIDEENIKIHGAKSGDYVYVAGKPKVGNEVVLDQGEIADTKTLMQLLNWDTISEIIPVGSSGILGELEKMKAFRSMEVELLKEIELDLEKSAGPCTALLIFTKQAQNNFLDIPWTWIGHVL